MARVVKSRVKKNITTHSHSHPDFRPAMSFVEIAEELGYRDPKTAGRKAIYDLYKHAMIKLRAKPEAFGALLALSADRQRMLDVQYSRP